MKQDNQRQAVIYAYLAGIVDGEGSISIGKHIRKTKIGDTCTLYMARLNVVNTNLEVMNFITKVFGKHYLGKERTTSKNRTLPTNVSDDHKLRVLNPNWNICYRWQINGTYAVLEILEKLYPYLIIKKKQAEIVMEFCRKRRNAKKRPRIRACRDCGKVKENHGYNLCGTCYRRHWKKGTLPKSWNRDGGYSYRPINHDLELLKNEELLQRVQKLNKGAKAQSSKVAATK